MTSLLSHASSSSLGVSDSISLRVISDVSLHILRTRGKPAELKGGFREVSNSSYITNDSNDSEATAYIPEFLESVETLQFLELNTDTAAMVWEHYLEDLRNLPERASTLRSARRYVISFPQDAFLEEDDWWGAMRAIGMTSNFQNRIMKEELKGMRLASSLKETICEMLEMRFEFLQSLDDVIKTPSKGISRKISRMGLDGKMKTLPGPVVPPRTSSQLPPLKTFAPASSSSSAATTVPARPETVDGCTMFLKGGTLTRLQSIHAASNVLNFKKIASTPPGDFSGSFRGIYLTKNQQAAWQYAQWASAVVDGLVVPIAILYVAIPNFLLASSKEIFGDEWRRWVWCCRRDDLVPNDLRYLREFQWLVGPLCHQSNIKVGKMKDLSELQVWKLDRGETASQHFACNDTIIELLSENCVGKVWIEIVQEFGGGKGKGH